MRKPEFQSPKNVRLGPCWGRLKLEYDRSGGIEGAVDDHESILALSLTSIRRKKK